MSVQQRLWDDGLSTPDSGGWEQSKRASLAREIRYLLTVARNAGKGGGLSPAGIAHSLSVCLIEDSNMARGGKGQGNRAAQTAMPRFVDIRLDQTQKQKFLQWFSPDADHVGWLQQFADDGYRVGVSWSGEHQSYTVSATCRDAASPNNGLCMTAFAGDLDKAIALLWFKHTLVAEGVWLDGVASPSEDFG